MVAKFWLMHWNTFNDSFMLPSSSQPVTKRQNEEQLVDLQQ